MHLDKTLLISEIFPPKTGGSGRWFWEIYRRLPRRQVVIAAGEQVGQEAFDATHDLRLTRLSLTLKTWGIRSFGGLRGYGRAVRRLRRIVRAEGVGMVHCGRCLPEGLMGRALKCLTGVPYLCYVHGEELNYAHTSREMAWLMRRVFARADLVIANSKNTRRMLLEEWHLPLERVCLLHPGVDTERFHPAPRDYEIRDGLGWGGRPVVLTVGRLQKRKGQDMLIRALETIRRTIPDVLYAIVGDGEERGCLEELVKQCQLGDHVQFLGELTDDRLVECYQQCDLFALPNRQVGQDIEGFGMVLLEAQACGKPVIAGASGGTAETMRAPETGRVVCCDGPELLADTAIELLDDAAMRQRMGTAAREWVVEQFDWEALSVRAATIFGCSSVSTRVPEVIGV